VITTIIGIDCAVDAKNTGLVRAHTAGETLIVAEALCGSRSHQSADIVANWIRGADRSLLALDAPLGWPAPLGNSLADHCAGAPLVPSAHQLFRRRTDDVIHGRLKRRSLDVGADRIARTAHAALALLEKLRALLEVPIDLAWSARETPRVRAIEVYPAGTRVALAVPAGKGSISGIENRLLLETALPDSEHVRDAIVCALTGLEFLAGRCVGPAEHERALALKEGWIWSPALRTP
jgi:predicted RNase H-like nuclease